MAEKFYPTRHTTIGSVIDAGLGINAFCLDCGHAEHVDLALLEKKLGRKFSALPVHLVPRLLCSQCGSKNVGMSLITREHAAPADQI